MRIPRHQYFFVTVTLADQHLEQAVRQFYQLPDLCTRVQFQIQQHLVVARTSAMYLLADIAQAACKHQFHLRMNVFHALFDHELTAVGHGIDVFQLRQQNRQFFFCEQPDAFQHRYMSHRAKNVVFSQVKVHLAVLTYGKCFDFLVYLYIFFPKFLSHNAEN